MVLIKLLNILVKSQRIQGFKYWGSSVVVSKMNSTCNEAININSFSSEDKRKILEVINSKNIEELLQYSITKKRAQNLELYRTNNGLYKSLEDLLQIKGINNKCLYEFYKSIIYNNKRNRKVRRNLVLTSKINGNEHMDVDTVLGIHVGHDLISWSLLNRDCEVLQWNYKSFLQDESKTDLDSLIPMILSIAAMLPKADRYIMQETHHKINRYNAYKFYQVYMKEVTISTIILSYLTMLNRKLDNTKFLMDNVFMLRRNVLQRIYNLVVGNEVVSTQYAMQKLMEENDEMSRFGEHLPNILIRSDLRQMYNKEKLINQEQISWSLLIALAFMELVVHQRTDMIIRNIE